MQNATVSAKSPYRFKPVLPKEHGTWMMLFLPYLLGVTFSSPRAHHIPLLLGWFLLYLSSAPLLAMARNRRMTKRMMPWAIGYLSFALFFLLPVLLAHPTLLLLGSAVPLFLLVHLIFIRRRDERNLCNDLSGILTLSLGGAAAYVVGTEALTSEAFWIVLYVVLYFMGSAFFVKSMIRERRNPRFAFSSHLYHLALIPVTWWFFPHPALLAAYMPSILKDWLTPRQSRLTPRQTGYIEIMNSLLFLFISVYALKYSGANA